MSQRCVASISHHLLPELVPLRALCTPSHTSPLSSLVRTATFCANGECAPWCERLKRLIKGGSPVLMLHNTGGVTQAFASIRKAILAGNPLPPKAGEILDQSSAHYLELVSPAPWVKKFGLPEVLMMLELHQRAPMLLRVRVALRGAGPAGRREARYRHRWFLPKVPVRPASGPSISCQLAPRAEPWGGWCQTVWPWHPTTLARRSGSVARAQAAWAAVTAAVAEDASFIVIV